MYLKNLVKLRQKKKWSQEKLAAEAEISYYTLIKLEQEKIQDPRIGTVIKIAKALSVSIDKLVGIK